MVFLLVAFTSMPEEVSGHLCDLDRARLRCQEKGSLIDWQGGNYLLEWGGPPLGDLVLVFLPMDNSMVGWIPCIFCLSTSSSLASL